MSWSWKEEREVKQYDTKGTVTISTEEFRDLINEANDLRMAGQKEHDDWYREYTRANDLQTKLDAVSKQLDSLETWLKDDIDSLKNYKLWRIDQERAVDEEE